MMSSVRPMAKAGMAHMSRAISMLASGEFFSRNSRAKNNPIAIEIPPIRGTAFL